MSVSNETIVIGHKNPDNDAICAAVGYAYLKNQLDPDGNYVACRQGPLPAETEWVLEEMGLPVPQYVEHIHSRVMDAMTSDVLTVSPDDILLDAGRTMREHDVQSLVVEDGDGRYKGIISMRKLSEIYIDEVDIVDTYETELVLEDVAKACGGRIVVGDPKKVLKGHLRVAASDSVTLKDLIGEGDVVVMGDRDKAQVVACEQKVSCLVLSGGTEPTDDLIALAESNGTAIVCSEHDSFTVTKLATLAHKVENYIETDALVLDPEALLNDTIPDILRSHQREGVVVDEDGHCIGIVTRSDVAVFPRRRVVLVDHNEKAQTLPGIEEAELVEVVDHHRLGDLSTASPIECLLMPWGSASTIVADQFRLYGVEMPKSIAGVLLSAMLTDTVLLKSPTTTDKDREIAEWLGGIAGVDVMEFGHELFHRRCNEAEIPMETVITGDSKEYEIGDKKVLVAQHETADMECSMGRSEEIQSYLDDMQANSSYDTILFLLTDIVNIGSQFFAAGDKHLVEKAFGIDLSAGSVWMDGILSRKKQVVTKLMSMDA